MASPRIAFSWNGLPQYAARLIRAAIDAVGEPCAVIGSRPGVPVEGMEQVLAQPVHWVDAAQPVSWASLGLAPPKVYVQSGWSYPAFSALGKAARAAGAIIIGLSDANWRGDLRQLAMGPLGFRLLHKPHFDAFLTPGIQGARLLRYFGMAPDRIRTGMYGADRALFSPGPPLKTRPREILFVGQFIPRKDVTRLAEAFLRVQPRHPGWTLRLCGSGPLADAIARHPTIRVEPFVQPQDLAARFHGARFLALPSLVEAWGLVVHEATLCGCGLILSTAVGSRDDLASLRNAFSHRPGDGENLAAALSAAMSADDAWLDSAERESQARAAHFGPARFAREIATLTDEVINPTQDAWKAA
jgi:glycosyltransferase involved in cell wall biosynthesis